MHKAAAWATMTLPEYPDATIEILDWPGTAVRVVAKIARHDHRGVRQDPQSWINYSNPELDIICEGEDGKRSAVSPSAIITERGYEMSLIFRNNSVSEELPEGIFMRIPSSGRSSRSTADRAQGWSSLPAVSSTSLA